MMKAVSGIPKIIRECPEADPQKKIDTMTRRDEDQFVVP